MSTEVFVVASGMEKTVSVEECNSFFFAGDLKTETPTARLQKI
jgi:hypothetical protein